MVLDVGCERDALSESLVPYDGNSPFAERKGAYVFSPFAERKGVRGMPCQLLAAATPPRPSPALVSVLWASLVRVPLRKRRGRTTLPPFAERKGVRGMASCWMPPPRASPCNATLVRAPLRKRRGRFPPSR